MNQGLDPNLKKIGYGTGTFKILRTGTGNFILLKKVTEPNRNF